MVRMLYSRPKILARDSLVTRNCSVVWGLVLSLWSRSDFWVTTSHSFVYVGHLSRNQDICRSIYFMHFTQKKKTTHRLLHRPFLSRPKTSKQLSYLFIYMFVIIYDMLCKTSEFSRNYVEASYAYITLCSMTDKLCCIAVEYHVSLWYACCILALKYWQETLWLLGTAALYGVWYWAYEAEVTSGWQHHIRLFM